LNQRAIAGQILLSDDGLERQGCGFKSSGQGACECCALSDQQSDALTQEAQQIAGVEDQSGNYGTVVFGTGVVRPPVKPTPVATEAIRLLCIKPRH
jgi:hypothetical protein